MKPAKRDSDSVSELVAILRKLRVDLVAFQKIRALVEQKRSRSV